MTREAIPLLDAPLYRFLLFRSGEQDGGLVMKLHHIISDGWTQILLCNRVGHAYLDLLSGEEPVLEPCPSYEAHVKEETNYLVSSAYQRDEAYWTNILEQSGEPSILKSVKGAVISPVGQRRSFVLPQSLNNSIYTFCTRNRVAPFSAFYLALAIYFKRIGGADRFTIGVPVYNRTNYACPSPIFSAWPENPAVTGCSTLPCPIKMGKCSPAGTPLCLFPGGGIIAAIRWSSSAST